MASYISTLQQIASQNCQKSVPYLASTIGCVIDASRSLFIQKQSKFLVEIKIIDESFNKISETNHLIKYCSIYLFSQKKQEINWNTKIGNFIYLHKFLFYKQEGIKLQGKFLGGFDCVYKIDSGQIEDIDSFRIQKKLGRQTSPLDIDNISNRIAEMKQWLITEFTKIFDPFLGVRIINNFCAYIQPSRMILKVININQNQIQSRLILNDSSENTYHLNLKYFKHILLKHNDWVYIRGIKFISTSFQITLTETGNFLILPQFYQQDYKKLSNYQAIYRKTNKSLTQKKNLNDLTYIAIQDGKATSIKELYGIQDKFKATIKKDDVNLPINYFIRAVLIGFKGKLKLYHTEYQMIVHDEYLKQISEQEKKQTLNQQKIIYVYEGQLTLMDNSVNSKKQFLKVKIFTQDQKSTFFQWKVLEKLIQHIGCSDQKQIVKDVQNYIKQKLQKVHKLSTFQNPAYMVLQPIKSDQLVFRLVHTYLI